jgi:hypothetical protein
MGRALAVASLVCFVLATFGVNPWGVTMLALGLAFFAASTLV